MNIDPTTPVGRIAAEHPLSTRVFARHGIDFCCGGGRPLAEVCETRNIDSNSIVGEIEAELSGPSESPERWDEAPLNDLVEHILYAYHQPLREELPRLEAMARRVLEVHRDKDPERLAELARLVSALRADVEFHMQKEEEILFPMVRKGEGFMADGPIAVMEEEHDTAAGILRRFRELTDDYTVPEQACNTWRALWHGLAALESALHMHIHLENNILFPRALEG
ncbi:MAG: iron-sulfur cluster repair di-iron protein [Thermoanaerobaculia bacterium]|nr:iron-sulfur cluster repair di-iron protein [Thermoanaerobaculia bacterium]